MANPLIFISHKHTDNAIATVIAKFIKDRSLGNVDVYLSSNWTFEGPRFGPNLNEELMSALWKSDALILVYTSSDQDWSYCMWECGVAAQASSPETRILVFQCGHDVPTPFSTGLRVDVRNPEHLRRFTKQLLTDPKFFPGRTEALAPHVDKDLIEKAALELFDGLKGVLPDAPSVDEWPAWPFMRIELPKIQADNLEGVTGNRTERKKALNEIVKEHSVVVKSDGRCAQLFGLANLADKTKFKELLKVWQERNHGVEATWFDSCCEQMRIGARREFPVIWQSSLKGESGDAGYTPVLSRVKYVPFGATMQFDFYFCNLSDPQAVLATSRMMPPEKFFYKNLGKSAPESIKLKDLVGELSKSGLNRIPVLSGEGHPLYIVHRSMIDKFVAENVFGKSNASPDSFTLADLLAEPDMKEIFKNTFVVVSKQCTLAEAKTAMLTRPSCSDVFVSENGNQDEEVMGWLTNVDIDRSN